MDSSVSSSRALFASAGLIAAIVFTATAVACDDDNDIITPTTTTFITTLAGANEVPAKAVAGTGTASIVKNGATYTYTITYSGMTGALTGAHIHGPAAVGVPGPILFPLPNGQVNDFQIALSPGQATDLKNGLWYANVHSNNFINGEIRGQFSSTPSTSSVQLSATQYVVNEGQGSVTLTVTRLGNTSGAASVDYATSDTAGSPGPARTPSTSSC